MSQIVEATFQDGVFKPHEELPLAPGTTVRLIVDRLDEIQSPTEGGCDELDELCAELPIESRSPRLTRDQLHERR